MSYNWTMQNVANILVTEDVLAHEIERGDVICDGNCFWAVAEIRTQHDGTIEILDEDENGFTQISTDDVMTRLPRSSVNREAILRNMKQERVV